MIALPDSPAADRRERHPMQCPQRSFAVRIQPRLECLASNKRPRTRPSTAADESAGQKIDLIDFIHIRRDRVNGVGWQVVTVGRLCDCGTFPERSTSIGNQRPISGRMIGVRGVRKLGLGVRCSNPPSPHFQNWPTFPVLYRPSATMLDRPIAFKRLVSLDDASGEPFVASADTISSSFRCRHG